MFLVRQSPRDERKSLSVSLTHDGELFTSTDLLYRVSEEIRCSSEVLHDSAVASLSETEELVVCLGRTGIDHDQKGQRRGITYIGQ